ALGGPVLVGACRRRRAVVARRYERRRIGTPHRLRPICRLCWRRRPIIGRRLAFDVLGGRCRLARWLRWLLTLRRRELMRMLDFCLSRRLCVRMLAVRRCAAAVATL